MKMGRWTMRNEERFLSALARQSVSRRTAIKA
ncbi:MAG: hypothetical protein AVDCRST_MAG87-1946, partial [uncultured Thermomicrobiales bacterium]